MLTDQLQVPFTFRFMTTPNWPGSYTVTYENLLDAWFLAGSATTAWQLFDFVKIKKVVVRGVGVQQIAALSLAPTCSVGIEFPGLVGGQFGSGKQRIATGMGFDQPAMVSLSPDALSQSAQYQPSTANPAFIVRATDQGRSPLGGAIIDVMVVLKNSGDVAPAAVTTARAGLTGGQIYFGGIDGLGTATTIAKSVFIPIA